MSLRPSPTIVVALALAVLAVLAVAGVEVLRSSANVERLARHAQTTEDELLRLQLDMETSLRGFVATHREPFMDPYRAASPRFRPTADALHADLVALDDRAGIHDLNVIRALHRNWLRTVAERSLQHRRVIVANQIRGKTLVDRIRNAHGQLSQSIDAQVQEAELRSQGLLIAIQAFAFLTLVGAIVSIAAAFRREAEVEKELRRERNVVETLQHAFSSRAQTFPHTSIGTVYQSASEEANVGGDLFDVRRIDERSGYVLIADVSGKGVQAAVDTALIRYSVNAIAQRSGDPAEILEELNRIFIAARSSDTSFLVAFLGVLDWDSLTFAYASGGHNGAFLRRGKDVTLLDVTGPAVGITAAAEYTTRTLRLMPGDLLVLATDGLTEARNAQRDMLMDTGAMEWVARVSGRSGQAVVNELLDTLNGWRHAGPRDDLAMLAVRIDEERAPAVQPAAGALGTRTPLPDGGLA